MQIADDILRRRAPANNSAQQDEPAYQHIPDEHVHYSQRSPWLRAAVLGGTDGLVSVSSLMLGVGGGSASLDALVLSGERCCEAYHNLRWVFISEPST